MMSRLSRRSVLDALLVCGLIGDSVTTWPPWCSGGAEDVDHEVQRVGALDAGGRLALLAVALLGRDREDQAATHLLADEGLVPPGDHLAGPDPAAGGGLGVALVERLLALVYLAAVLDRDRLALLHRRAGALDEHRGPELAVGLRRTGEVQGRHRRALLDDLRRPRGRRLSLALRTAERGLRLADDVDDHQDRVLVADVELGVAALTEQLVGRRRHRDPRPDGRPGHRVGQDRAEVVVDGDALRTALVVGAVRRLLGVA